VPKTKQQPLQQGTTKLNGFVGCQFDSVSVDAINRQIHDETGAVVALGDTAEWGHAKAAKVFETRETTKFADSFIRKHRPETFSGKVGHFVPHNKADMVMGRGMRTALEACIEVRVGPSSGTGDERHAMITEGDASEGWRQDGEGFRGRGRGGLDHGWWRCRRPKWERNADVARTSARAYLVSHFQIATFIMESFNTGSL
jgi:hypothetical protein